MGFGGSAQAMITIIKNNKNMLSKRKDKGIRFVHTSTEKTEYDLPESTPETIKRIREKILRENKQRRIKRLLLTGTLSLVLIIGFVYFVLL